MANAYDPYREALVVETNTIWPNELAELSPAVRSKVEAALHSDPARATNLDYSRLHTGFCRDITVTPADVDRVQ